MSISLGLYDVFANIVPGLLFFYVLNEVSGLFGWQSFDLNKIDTFGQTLTIIFVAFVLGNIISSLTFRNWYKLFFKRHAAELSLARLKRQHPKLKFDFDIDDGEIVFAVIKHHDRQLAEKIETTRVNSIMMRNISFGIFLFALLQFYLLLSQRNLLHLGSGLIALVFSAFSLRRAVTMDRWFFSDVFREALNYGNNIREVLAKSKGKVSKGTTKNASS